MTKQEFLHNLTVALNLNVSDAVIHEQLAYYDKYISDEIAKGRSETEVIESLGSPRLLAKTIIETAEAAGDPVANLDEEVRGTIDTEPYSSAFDDYHNRMQDDGYYQDGDGNGDTFQQHNTSEQSYSEVHRNYGDTQSRNHEKETGSPSFHDFINRPYGHVFDTSGWGCLVMLIIGILLLGLIGRILGGIFMLLSPVLLPALVIVVVLWFLKGIFK